MPRRRRMGWGHSRFVRDTASQETAEPSTTARDGLLAAQVRHKSILSKCETDLF